MAGISDVVIVGGAVLGSAVAYFLRKEGFAGDIAVIERDATYAASATGRSVGGLRQQFSTPENIRMSLFTLAFVRGLKDEFGPDADVAFQERGYLVLASDEGRAILAENHALQRREGADIALLEAPTLARRFPWLATDGIAAGGFGRSGEGWIDPMSLANLLRKGAQERGARYVSGTVTGFDVAADRVREVRLADGQSIACGAVVNAAGPQAGTLARMAGLELPVEPRKRFVYVLDCRDAPAELARAPLTVDASGVWFRPEGRTFITGRSPDAAEEPPAADLDVIDHAFFEERIWPLLAGRVPAFEAIKVVNAWAGFYDYNTLDQNAVLGPHPDIRNFYFVNGFSGHGLQQAPAAGRAIAELIVHGRYRTIDLARLGYERIARGEPLPERNVI